MDRNLIRHRVMVALIRNDRDTGRLARATARRERRQAWLNDIEACDEDGFVALICWSRDCDHVCGESLALVSATPQAVDFHMNNCLAFAEGPMTFRLQRPSAHFQSWQRDTILEAMENDHGPVRDAFSAWE